MARNEAFAALQKEAMLAIVASLAKGFSFDSKKNRKLTFGCRLQNA